MKTTFTIAGAVLLALSGFAQATNVFRAANVTGSNTNNVAGYAITGGFYSERGEQITLAPATPRQLTELSLNYLWGTQPGLIQGDEKLRVILYNADGASITVPIAGSIPGPGTVILDTGLVSMPSVGGGVVRIPVAPTTVPDTFYIVWQSDGVTVPTADVYHDYLGPNFIGPPVVGTRDNNGNNWMIRRDVVGAWTVQDFSANANLAGKCGFGFSLWAGGTALLPYDNVTNTTDNTWTSDINELGFNISFEGSNRVMDSLDVVYASDMTASTGLETIQVKIYDRDQAHLSSAYAPASYGGSLEGPPGNVLYDSGALVLGASAAAGTWMLSLPLNGLDLTNYPNCVVSVGFTGHSPGIVGSDLGPVLMGAPNSGVGQMRTWQIDATVNTNAPHWTMLYSFGAAGPGANLAATFTPRVMIHATTKTKVRGGDISGSFANVDASDNVRYVLRPGVTFSNAQDPVELEFIAFAPAATASSLKFNIEDQVSGLAIRRKRQIFDYTAGGGAGAYVLLNSPADPVFGAANTDETASATLTPATAIKAGTFEMKSRVSYRAFSAVFGYPWNARVDHVWWEYIP